MFAVYEVHVYESRNSVQSLIKNSYSMFVSPQPPIATKCAATNVWSNVIFANAAVAPLVAVEPAPIFALSISEWRQLCKVNNDKLNDASSSHVSTPLSPHAASSFQRIKTSLQF